MDAPTLAAPVDPSALAQVLRPFGESEGLPREAYVSPAVHQWELGAFLDDAWVCVGRAQALDQVGAQRAIRAGREGVLLVRDQSGEIRGFYNVCRHRAHELVQVGDCVRGRQIRCPYHGWVYELDGALRGQRRELEPRGLVPVRVEIWRGFVFVNLSGTAIPLKEWLGDLDALTAAHDLESLQIAATHSYELVANWKLVVENYHECYHCPLIHPQLCKVSPPNSGQNYSGAGAWIGGPMELMPHVETMSFDGKSVGAPLPRLSPAQRRSVFYYGVGANLLISLHPDYVLTHRLEPLAPDRTRVECQWLFHPDAIAAPAFSPAYAVDFWDMTNRQDWRAVESVHRGVSSRGFRPGVFASREQAVYEFVTRVARGYRDGGWAQPPRGPASTSPGCPADCPSAP
ncbi:aromatic ring-hydroxylating oxygenase subunit alpha [Nannocystis pusilla]|uniref:Aromatic ring-hydroxylating dioxygenase subunit alpha n=1 Tax=Nannocystis pusilla TaxID=889268 RepID=A0ABS7U4P4_9BACT|nr:aromatic ring-hydroxylating dioxygenase subunit alpha [Nannocystis pusilla]MBZ5715246.1 aromatic ring-hydroxylating dioxygenase subunit alpha [Nannocystis pusilla]